MSVDDSRKDVNCLSDSEKQEALDFTFDLSLLLNYLNYVKNMLDNKVDVVYNDN